MRMIFLWVLVVMMPAIIAFDLDEFLPIRARWFRRADDFVLVTGTLVIGAFLAGAVIVLVARLVERFCSSAWVVGTLACVLSLLLLAFPLLGAAYCALTFVCLWVPLSAIFFSYVLIPASRTA
jgi:hypothetical protein